MMFSVKGQQVVSGKSQSKCVKGSAEREEKMEDYRAWAEEVLR